MTRKRKDFAEHGVYAYRHGCRCINCKNAIAELQAKYRERRKQRPGRYKVRYGSSDLRLSAEPLIAYLERTNQLHLVDRQAVQWWRTEGMSVYKVDEYAIRYGTHPVLLYGEAFYEGCDA